MKSIYHETESLLLRPSSLICGLLHSSWLKITNMLKGIYLAKFSQGPCGDELWHCELFFADNVLHTPDLSPFVVCAFAGRE